MKSVDIFMQSCIELFVQKNQFVTTSSLFSPTSNKRLVNELLNIIHKDKLPISLLPLHVVHNTKQFLVDLHTSNYVLMGEYNADY